MELTDGTSITFGFQLDTLTTHNQFTTPMPRGKEVRNTYTDFVNPYLSALQTTNYNFKASGTTNEVCVGVVKVQPLHSKSPAQHSADLQMLNEKRVFRMYFVMIMVCPSLLTAIE